MYRSLKYPGCGKYAAIIVSKQCFHKYKAKNRIYQLPQFSPREMLLYTLCVVVSLIICCFFKYGNYYILTPPHSPGSNPINNLWEHPDAKSENTILVSSTFGYEAPHCVKLQDDLSEGHPKSLLCQSMLCTNLYLYSSLPEHFF